MIAFEAVLAGLPVRSPLPFNLNARRCLKLDLSADNSDFREVDPANTKLFSSWISVQLADAEAEYGAGGYLEDRPLYARSKVFNNDGTEARTLHLGVDLWLEAGTAVHTPLAGVVHSTADNARPSDYGPTVIIEHQVRGERFYTLYGHLARPSLRRVTPGQALNAGELIGWLGIEEENGRWPSHLHFQIIRDLDGAKGDFPGVCKPSERALWASRCPNPNLLLRIEALRS